MALSCYPKKRSVILLWAFLSTIANAIVYILLGAYAGLAMCFVSTIKSVLKIMMF